MQRYDWNNEGIHLDSCPMCKGRWLDGGEVRAIHEEWDREPLGTHEMTELVRKVKQVEQETSANWQEESFTQWLLKRLTFTSRRKGKE